MKKKKKAKPTEYQKPLGELLNEITGILRNEAGSLDALPDEAFGAVLCSGQTLSELERATKLLKRLRSGIVKESYER